MAENKSDVLLRVSNVCKAFYGHTVLDNVSFDLDYGQVLGLVGQNGAGKSTMVKILTGAYQKDSGSIQVAGKEADLSSIRAANASGVALVFQELSLALNMTVADNIFVGNLPTGMANLVRTNELYAKAQELIDKFNVNIRPDEKVENLTIGKRQIVEIIKAIAKNPKVLILDEPTSSLEEAEIKVLFEFIRKLKSSGLSIIYISHHMSEIFDIVDQIIVLRDGHKIRECPKEELDVQELISLMIGQEYQSYTGSAEEREIDSEIVFTAQGLCKAPYFDNINFTVAKGEIVGIAGIIGSGKTELCEAIYGVRQLDAGRISLCDKTVAAHAPSESKGAGILFIPENRKTQGLFLNDTVRNNAIACVLRKVSTGIFLDDRKIDAMVSGYQKSIKIKMSSDQQIIRFLSGGNQQKVLVAKCIADDPKLLIAMDPTRGIDVAAKADIHKIMHDLSEQGLSIIVISSELDELMTLCDRIIVMNSGKQTAQYSRSQFNEVDILLSMHHHQTTEQ